MTDTTDNKHTPGPWKWEGEDYRGGWGWQLLVGQNGEGIACGSDKDAPYKHLQARMPIDPKYCKTGMLADEDSAPGIHVREADAHLIAAAPELLEACRVLAGYDNNTHMTMEAIDQIIAKAEGRSE